MVAPLVVPNEYLSAEQLLAVELEVAGKMRAANEERQPVPVVRPHFVVGDGTERRPEWDGFIGLPRLPLEIMGEEDSAIQAVAVAELKMQFAMLFGPERFDAELLEGLASARPGAAFRPDPPCRRVR